MSAIRMLGFWASDMLSGGGMADILAEYVPLAQGERPPQAIRQARLEGLLSLAVSSTRFYRGRTVSNGLRDFPVVRKEMIRSRRDEFVADGQSVAKVSFSSGSYAAPMEFPMTRQKVQRRRAEALFFNGLAGYRVGMRFAMVNSLVHWRKPWVRRYLRNEVDINILDLSEAALSRALERLGRGDIRFIVGQPSLLQPLAKRLLESEYDLPRPMGVVSYGELLGAEAKRVIESGFKCRVLNRYASNEFGILAHTIDGGDELRVNEVGYVVELLKPGCDTEAREGELGRVVVTDLFSHAMPLIRYDTGDLAVRSVSAGEGMVLRGLEGRLIETLQTPSGDILPPIRILDAVRNSEMRKMAQFRIIQHSEDTYSIKVVSAQPPDLPAIHEDMVKLFGEAASIRVDVVPAIEPLPSGKRPVSISELAR